MNDMNAAREAKLAEIRNDTKDQGTPEAADAPKRNLLDERLMRDFVTNRTQTVKDQIDRTKMSGPQLLTFTVDGRTRNEEARAIAQGVLKFPLEVAAESNGEVWCAVNQFDHGDMPVITMAILLMEKLHVAPITEEDKLAAAERELNDGESRLNDGVEKIESEAN